MKKEEKEAFKQLYKETEIEELLRWIDENRKTIMIILGFFLLLVGTFWYVELKKEMDMIDVCKHNNLTYKYSLKCTQVNEFGDTLWYGLIEQEGEKKLYFYGLKIKGEGYQFPLR